MKLCILLLFLASLFFFSCQKQLSGTIDTVAVDSTITHPYSNKLKTYSEDVTSGGTHTSVTFDIAYDASDRVISAISEASPGDKFIYQYISNTSLTMDLYNSNVLSIHENFFLNSSSLLDSTFQYNDTNDSSTEKYIYNAAKQLIQLKEYDYSLSAGAVLSDTHNYTYDSNGNQVSDTDDLSAITFDYYPIINNVVVFPYLTTTPVNLIKTTSINGGTEIINHTYTFDSKKRVSTETQQVAGSNEAVIKTYTYTD